MLIGKDFSCKALEILKLLPWEGAELWRGKDKQCMGEVWKKGFKVKIKNTLGSRIMHEGQWVLPVAG